MIRSKTMMVGVAAVTVGATSPALARYYQIDDVKAQLCEKEFNENKDWRFNQTYPYAFGSGKDCAVNPCHSIFSV
jgi:hypothetical protein